VNTDLPIIVINLDRVPERMTAVKAQFTRAGLARQVDRFAAIDAQQPGFTVPGYSPGSWRDRWALLPSELAIFASHRAVWQQVADGRAQGAVICEDDILVSTRFGLALRALELDRLGIVKLDGFSAARRYGPVAQAGEFEVRDILEPVPSAACYAIGKAAAQRLLAESATFCATLDDFVFARRKWVRPVQLFPAVAVQGMCCGSDPSVPEAIAQSERDPSSAPPRPSADKGPLLYRARKEGARTFRKLKAALGSANRLKKRGGVICRPNLARDLPAYKS